MLIIAKVCHGRGLRDDSKCHNMSTLGYRDPDDSRTMAGHGLERGAGTAALLLGYASMQDMYIILELYRVPRGGLGGPNQGCAHNVVAHAVTCSPAGRV